MLIILLDANKLIEISSVFGRLKSTQITLGDIKETYHHHQNLFVQMLLMPFQCCHQPHQRSQ